MDAQFNNRVMTSFFLWMDHTILKKGNAYITFGSKLYNVRDNFNNLYSYGLPFKQIVADSSIGTTVMSGVYLNGSFLSTGQSGLVDINYYEGQAYFSSNKDSDIISGNYAVKDFNIYLSNEPDYKLIFEKRHIVQPRTSRALTGLAPEDRTIPGIFLINRNLANEPFAFGGTDTTEIDIRAIVFSDNGFKLDAVNSILNDRVRTLVPIFNTSQLPFNHYGGFKTGSYNFQSLDSSTQTKAFISKVQVSHISNASIIIREIRDLYEDVFTSVIDFKLETQRNPRT